MENAENATVIVNLVPVIQPNVYHVRQDINSTPTEFVYQQKELSLKYLLTWIFYLTVQTLWVF